MIRRIILSLCLAIACFSCTQKPNSKIADGIYLVKDEVPDSLHIRPLAGDEQVITYNPRFTDDSSQDLSKLIVSTDQFVAMRLKKMPEKVEQLDHRKMLFLDFKDETAKKLEEFTAHNLSQKVAIVIGCEAVTIHKIRAVITGGKLQVSRCTDNACEHLYYELEDDVK
jgi:preprotein translocase subunit SecD